MEIPSDEKAKFLRAVIDYQVELLARIATKIHGLTFHDRKLFREAIRKEIPKFLLSCCSSIAWIVNGCSVFKLHAELSHSICKALVEVWALWEWLWHFLVPSGGFA